MTKPMETDQPMIEYRKIVNSQMSEAELQTNVVDMAMRLGWSISWIPDAFYRTMFGKMKNGTGHAVANWSPPGEPDLRMARRGRIIFAELKSQKGQLRAEQKVWLHDLALAEKRSAGTIAVAVWRPSDWNDGTVERELRREHPDYDENGRWLGDDAVRPTDES